MTLESSNRASIFVDELSIAGRNIEKPTMEDFLFLECELKGGKLLPFSIARQSDRDAGMDVHFSEGLFAIVGAEDSNERGVFAFCYVDFQKSSKPIQVGADVYPEYCTTNDINIVIRVAREYFQTGMLERSVNWHVSRRGIGRKLKEIPQSEILHAKDSNESLDQVLSLQV